MDNPRPPLPTFEEWLLAKGITDPAALHPNERALWKAGYAAEMNIARAKRQSQESRLGETPGLDIRARADDLAAPKPSTHLTAMVPPNVSMQKASLDTTWTAPTLADFTHKTWAQLTDKQKRRIAGHYAYSSEMPPKSFGSLKLPHHDPRSHKVVFKGVVAAAGRLGMSDIPVGDIARVKSHLRAHYAQFKKPVPDSLKATEAERLAARIGNALVLSSPIKIAAAASDAEGGGAKKPRTFTITAYTGGPLEQSWWGDLVIVDLEGIDVGSGVLPILDEHLADKKHIIGRSETAGVENGGLVLRGILYDPTADTDAGCAIKEILSLADQGHPWQASIGARCLQKDFIAEGNTVQVNGQTFEGPVFVSRKTMIREVSFVAIGADPYTKVLVASRGTIMAMTFAEYCKTHGFDADTMSEAQKAYMQKNWKEETDDDDDDSSTTDSSTSSTNDSSTSDSATDDSEMENSASDMEADAADGDPPGSTTAKASGSRNIKANGKRRKIKGKGPLMNIKAQMKITRREIVIENKRVRAITELTAANPDLVGEFPDPAKKGKRIRANIRDHAILHGYTAEQIGPIFALAELRSERRREVPGVPGGHAYSTSRPIMTGEVLEAAILQAGGCKLHHNSFYFDRSTKGLDKRRVSEEIQADTQREMRARYTDQVMQAAHDHFGATGINLQQILIIAARAGGYTGSEKIHTGNLGEVLRCGFGQGLIIRAEGGSTISIQNVLANVMNKFLLQGYLYVDQSWRKIAALRPVKDFKPTKSINVFGDFIFKKLNADGQIENATMSDEAFANQIDTFARMLGIGRQMIINDDLSALTTVPILFGRGSANGISKLFWTLWLNPPVWGTANGGDNNAFWYARTIAANQLGGGAANSNLSTGSTNSALSSLGLQNAVQLFAKQVAPDGQPLGVKPAILLYPPELDVAATELMNSEFLIYGGSTASKQPQKNVWQGRFEPVESPYLSNPNYTGYSATGWYLTADPGFIPVIEMAFLNGQETPTVQTAQANFNELGVDIRGFHDYGAAMQNVRGGVKSTGA